MTTQEVMHYVRAQPFRPFRIRMESGRTFDIRHPKMIRVGKLDLHIFTYTGDSLDIHDSWDTVGLSLIESILPLEPSVA